MMVAFLFMLVGQLQYIARESYAEIAFLPLRWLVQALALLFPNLQVFNIGDQLGHAAAGGLPLGVVFQILVYAGAYTLAYLGLAWWNFKRREL
jgi:hypothetical protein